MRILRKKYLLRGVAFFSRTRGRWSYNHRVANPSVHVPGESAKLALFGDSCIDAAERLTNHHEQLLRALEDGVAVELDLGGVSRMDTAGLQLVLAFVMEMKRHERPVRIATASEVVRQCAKTAGVVELLGLDPL